MEVNQCLHSVFGTILSSKILNNFSVFEELVDSITSSTSMRMMLSFFTSFLLLLLFGKKCIRALFMAKVGQHIRDDDGFLLAELHKSKKNTPTMGGLMLALTTCISCLIWSDLSSPFPWILLATTITFTSIGACDDWAKLKNKSAKGLSGRMRMAVQTIFSAVVLFLLWSSSFEGFHPELQYEGAQMPWHEWLQSIFIPFMSHPIITTSLIGIIITILIQWCAIVGSANAVNLTDGLDGLASGCSLFVTAFLALFAFFSNNVQLAELHGLTYIQTSGEIAVYLAGLSGAILGFLWFNSHPAQVFMGDTGSLAIGGTLGMSSVLLKAEWYLALVGLIFVLETMSVIIQVISFRMTGNRVFRCAPLHHHFEYMGIHESKVVIRFWIIAFLLAVVGALSLKI